MLGVNGALSRVKFLVTKTNTKNTSFQMRKG